MDELSQMRTRLQLGRVAVLVSLVAVCAISIAAMSLGPGYTLGLCGLVLLLILVLVQASTSVWIFLACICILLSSSAWSGESGSSSAVLRFIAIALIVLSLVSSQPKPLRPAHTSTPNVAGLFIPLFFYLIFAMLAHGAWSDFFSYTASLIMFALALRVVPRLTSVGLYHGLLIALLVAVASSVAAGFFLPEIAIAGGRLRGLTSNANLLAFYSFCLVALAILCRPRSALSRVTLALGLISLFWTGSRASLLAIGVLFLCRVAFGQKEKRSGSWILIGLLLFTIFAMGIGDTFFDKTLNADTNSRTGTLNEALRVLEIAPFTGIGMNESVEVASTPLRAFVHAGVWGILAIAGMWIALIAAGRRHGWRASALAMASITHSCFEGWMLSPIGPIFMIFIMMWFVVLRVGNEGDGGL